MAAETETRNILVKESLSSLPTPKLIRVDDDDLDEMTQAEYDEISRQAKEVRTGAELVDHWTRNGLIGNLPDTGESTAKIARRLRAQSERRGTQE